MVRLQVGVHPSETHNYVDQELIAGLWQNPWHWVGKVLNDFYGSYTKPSMDLGGTETEKDIRERKIIFQNGNYF